MNFDDQLRSALQRKEPPPRFAERVIAATNRRGRWRAIAAAITVTAVIGAWSAHQIVERREGERARQEVLLALRITSEKVNYARTQVHEIGSRK